MQGKVKHSCSVFIWFNFNEKETYSYLKGPKKNKYLSPSCAHRFTQNLSLFRRDVNESLKGPVNNPLMAANDMMTWDCIQTVKKKPQLDSANAPCFLTSHPLIVLNGFLPEFRSVLLRCMFISSIMKSLMTQYEHFVGMYWVAARFANFFAASLFIFFCLSEWVILQVFLLDTFFLFHYFLANLWSTPVMNNKIWFSLSRSLHRIGHCAARLVTVTGSMPFPWGVPIHTIKWKNTCSNLVFGRLIQSK